MPFIEKRSQPGLTDEPQSNLFYQWLVVAVVRKEDVVQGGITHDSSQCCGRRTGPNMRMNTLPPEQITGYTRGFGKRWAEISVVSNKFSTACTLPEFIHKTSSPARRARIPCAASESAIASLPAARFSKHAHFRPACSNQNRASAMIWPLLFMIGS